MIDDADFITIELGEGIGTMEEEQGENKHEDANTQSESMPNMQPVVILNDIKILTSENKVHNCIYNLCIFVFLQTSMKQNQILKQTI